MTKSTLSKIIVGRETKSLLEESLSFKLLLSVPKSPNSQNLSNLVKQGRENALAYLERKSFGQKLTFLEETNLFNIISSLKKSLSLTKIPRRIECYDISHLSGTHVYGSMVVFVDGKPVKKFYRLFKCPNRNDDYLNHQEVLARRLQRQRNYPDLVAWELPDLIIVDGGKGQLTADAKILFNFHVQNQVSIVSLAKREEEIFLLDKSSVELEGNQKFLVQRIRDEAHRFAISNNKKSRIRQASKSELDNIPGIGSKTKILLLQKIGSISQIIEKLQHNPVIISQLIGDYKTEKIKNYFDL